MGNPVANQVIQSLLNQGYVVIKDYPYLSRTFTPRVNVAIEKELEGHTLQFKGIYERAIPLLKQWIATVSQESTNLETPYWTNGWFPLLDAISLAYFLVTEHPRIYVEVGSGNSTKFAHSVIQHFGLSTQIISIDPNPRAEINDLCFEIIRAPFETCYQLIMSYFNDKTILFIDNSHRAFPGSDVTTFFMDVLPDLPKGVIWGLHDIFLPYDYPDAWNKEGRFYNEQYLMGAYILGGHQCDSIVLPVHYCERNRLFPAEMIPKNIPSHFCGGGAFWMQRHSPIL